eukprot:TRINITY_DN19922_c0_g1_i1.p1 TRINITY_DN19922_c0_g1~~TRINITY_DN19922_c0_g1_i1.p1  ORF type:complete len:568 (+),score=69.48 TRINITY_DN19922_c0_g1_i1:36-1706(+)
MGNETAPGETDEVEQSMILLLVFIILLLSFVCNRIVQKFDLKWMSQSATTVLVGLAVGSFMNFAVGGVYKEAVKFDEDTFTYFILPPIIFEAGFSLRHKGVTENLLPIVTLAVFGTVLTALLLGFMIHGIAKSHFEPLYDRSIWESMCFGAVLSAIDPVAVLAVLGRMFVGKTPPKIFYVIFGESVLNDAVAIVLYKVFLKFLKEGKDLDAGTLFESLALFIGITLGSICIGWIVAAGSALLLKYVDFSQSPTAELCIIIFFGFGSFYVAEALHLSGIMALFICGRASCHYSWHNMATLSQVTAPQLLHVLAFIAETYVFSFLGLAFWSFEHDWKIGFTLLVLLCLFATRMLTVFPLVSLTNLTVPKGKRLGFKSQVFMSLTGLRGAIAFGLSLAANESPYISDESGRQFVSTTLIVIVLSVFTFGNFSQYLFEFLGLHKVEEPSPSLPGKKNPSAILQRCILFEKTYIAPYLRVSDHHTQHERRYTEISRVLEDIQEKYDIRGRPQKQRGEKREDVEGEDCENTPPTDITDMEGEETVQCEAMAGCPKAEDQEAV